MTKIITITQAQQKIAEISKEISKNTFVVTNRGMGKIVMLPYYDGCDANIAEYMEDFEMKKNQSTLKDRYKKSAKSGKSKLRI